MLEAILFSLFAYLVGSLSTAVIVSRFFDLPDPRSVGSKNPGATNVLRLGGKKAGIATLLGDLLKGFISVYLAVYLKMPECIIASVMLAVFLGHLYPIFFQFQGGKGVATAAGILLALDWRVGFGIILLWVLVVCCFRISSLAALMAAFIAPFGVAYLYPGRMDYIMVVILMSVFLVGRHRSNLLRLWRGQEPKLGQKTLG